MLNTDVDTVEAQSRDQFVGYIITYALFDGIVSWLVVFVEHCMAHNGLPALTQRPLALVCDPLGTPWNPLLGKYYETVHPSPR